MDTMRLSDKVDLNVMYDAESTSYSEKIRGLATRETFMEMFGNAPSRGFEYQGKCIGGIIVDGNNVHVSVLPEFQGKWCLSAYRDALGWALSLASPLYAKVCADNQKCIRFCERGGWEKVRTVTGGIVDVYIYKSNDQLFQKLTGRTSARLKIQ